MAEDLIVANPQILDGKPVVVTHDALGGVAA